jgi:hypothetical protein
MSMIDAVTAMALFRLHKGNRAGINRKPEMESVCLICGAVHVKADPNDPRKRVCRSCGFAFFRYECPACAQVVDSRDPSNPHCPICRGRKCTCDRCDCNLTIESAG